MTYWEDRFTAEQQNKAGAAMKAFRKSRKTRNDEHILYEGLTNAGFTSEEADEMINLEMENGE